MQYIHIQICILLLCETNVNKIHSPLLYIFIIYIHTHVDQICVQLHTCTYMSICLYVCAAAISVFTSLSCGRVKECACADTNLT